MLYCFETNFVHKIMKRWRWESKNFVYNKTFKGTKWKRSSDHGHIQLWDLCKISDYLLLVNLFVVIWLSKWQTQSSANPCALIGSFSVRILQYGPFPWKRSNPCIFVLERSRQIQNECHIINNLLTKLARAVQWNTGPRSFLYGPRCARSILSPPRANSPVRPSRLVSKRLIFC